MAMNSEKTICDILKFEGIMSKGFGMAPRLVMRDTRLSIEAKAIYCYFQSFAGSAEKAFPKRETILKELGIGKNRYYKYLQELIDYDYVRIEREEDEKSWKGRNIYAIVANPQSDDPDPPERKDAGKGPTGKGMDQKASASCQAAPKKKTAPGTLYRKLELPSLLEKYPDEKKMLLNVYEAVKDMDSSEELKIGGAVKKKDAIKETVGRLTAKHIIAVLKAVRENKEKISNMRAWMQACLVNSLYDDELDRKVKTFDAQYRAGTAKAAEDGARKEESAKAGKKDRIPFLMEKEKEINSLYAQMARGKIHGDSGTVESLRKKIAIIESEMEAFIHDNGIDPALYAFA